MFTKLKVISLFALFGCILGAPREHLEFEQPTGRIIDGTPMNISEVPWQVSLQFNDGTSHFCGGSIIGDRWILTAAHCLGGARLIRVRIGATHVYSEGKLIDAEETFLHPKFDARVGHRFDFDFGLIKLQKPIEFNDKVRAITLPDYADENDAAGTECLVAGWGRTIEGGSISTTLLGVKTPIVDHKACKKAYGQSNTVTPRMICAGYANGGKNTCQGDSGGALVSFGTGDPVVIGTVSWAMGCARPNYPTVFGRVLAAREWIHSQTGI